MGKTTGRVSPGLARVDCPPAIPALFLMLSILSLSKERNANGSLKRDL